MNTYCHSDVNLLQKGMEKLREQFLMLTKVDSTPMDLGGPFQLHDDCRCRVCWHFCTYFLPKDTIITVPCPPNENHSFKQILWHEYVADTNTRLFIQHVGEKAIHVPSGKCWKWMVLWSNKYRVPVWWLFLSQVSFLLQSCRSSTSSCEDEERKNQKKVQLPIKLCKMYVNTEVNTNK